MRRGGRAQSRLTLIRVLFQISLTSLLSAAELRAGTMSGMSDETEHPQPACTMSPPTLFDKPVSNNGARCRIIIYKKGLVLGLDIVIKSPDELGGLKSAEYLALNPQGKMPVLVTSHGIIPESDTIARYLLDAFAKGPSFTPSTIEARVKSDLLCRLHDMYITTIQGCLYKEAPPFGAYHSRYKALEELKRQLLIVDSNVDGAGPYLAGADLSLADATLFPTLVFVFYMLPKFVESWDAERVVGAKLLKWFEWIKNADSVFARVFEEMQKELEVWDSGGRWDKLLYAGAKDTHAPTIFDRVLRKEIPSTTVFEDEDVLVFHDIHPQAPIHYLIIPKRRENLTQLRGATAEHREVLGHMLATAARLAREQKMRGYRLVINDGAEAQQSVYHMHMHLLSGRALRWPPG